VVRCRELLVAARKKPKPTTPPAERPRSLLPPIVAGVGAAGLGIGLAMASAARGRHDEAVLEPTQAGAQDKQDSAVSLMRSANITMIAAGSLAAAGLAWWIIDVATHRAPKRTTALHVGPGSIGVTVAF